MQDSDTAWIVDAIRLNSFTHVVEMIRFAACGRFGATAWGMMAALRPRAFLLSVRGYDLRKGMLGRKPRDEG